MWVRRTKEVANLLRDLLGCEPVEGSSQVRDELTCLNVSHIQRVLRIEFFEEPEHVSTEGTTRGRVWVEAITKSRTPNS